MKIFYWSPFSSNIATIHAVLNSAKSLKKYGKIYEPTIINVNGEWDHYKKNLDLSFIDLNKNKINNLIENRGYFSSRLISILTFFQSFLKLKNLLKEKKPKYLIIHLITFVPILIFLFFNFRTKLILRISGYPKLTFFRKVLWKKINKFIYKVTCPSVSTMNELQKEQIFQKDKLVLVYDPVVMISKICIQRKEKLLDHQKFFEKAKVIISIGRFTKQKNLLYLINQFQIIKKEFNDVKLLMLGDGEQKNNILKEIKKKKLDSDIMILGHQKNIFKYLKFANCFVLTSLYEDPGFVLIEAAVSEIPILSSKCKNGPKDFFINNDNGFQIDLNSANDLFYKYKDFRTCKNNIIQKKKINAKKYSTNFTIFNHYKQLSNIFN
jgi:glycosyltransferase involved in cell wall biosynthesis